MDPIVDAYLFFAIASALLAAAAIGAWVSERMARPAERPSPVWSFNNMPAGARVDTRRSVRESALRGLA